MVKKNIMMVMPVMKGGGAERVAAQLMNEFHRKGHNVRFLLTSSRGDEVIRTDLYPEIPLILLQEELEQKDEGVSSVLSRKLASTFCRFYETVGKPVPAGLARWAFMTQYGKEVKSLREIMKAEPDLTVIAFLQPSIPMAALAGQGLPNRMIFSERGNPQRLMKHRYGRKFIEKYYVQFSHGVFQTEDARAAYPSNISENGKVILNPVKEGLPEPYKGERNKYITTFCRISKQKNLMLLLEAFTILHGEHPDYKLKIIGDALNEEGKIVLKDLRRYVEQQELESQVVFIPFSSNVHLTILKDAMYVNSSDYEGISNAMLEAMAIGLPVVCTDCPIGGARATIKHEENGMLVPISDATALCNAMKKIIEDEALATCLAENGLELRKKLSVEQVANKWMELL